MLILWELHLFDFRYKFKSKSKTDLEEQIKSPSNDTKPKVRTYYNFRTRHRSPKTFALTRVSQILIVRRESRGKCEKEGIWFGKLCIVLRIIHLCWKFWGKIDKKSDFNLGSVFPSCFYNKYMFEGRNIYCLGFEFRFKKKKLKICYN